MAIKLFATLAFPAAALVALSAMSSDAIAQRGPQGASQSQLEGITVVAPRITHRRERGLGSRTLVSTAEQKAFVEYSDLDLTRTSDLYALETRVVDAAENLCRELAEMYPVGEPDTDICIRRAVDDAMVQVQRAARQEIALARTDDWD